MKKSTAEIIYRELRDKGIHQENITDSDITHVYNVLKTTESGPDFKSILEILPPENKAADYDESPIFGIIVETRKHHALDIVVNNFIHTCGKIQIFHGKNNLDFIMSTSISKLVCDGKVHLTELNTDELCANKYNALFLSKRFWRSVHGRNKILVFQTDSISCGSSNYTINDFTSFDYIGSKWPRQRPVGLVLDGGNGGLSLRDWEKTYDCLTRFPPQNWSAGEDGYFAFHIALTGGKVGLENDCAKFSTQHEFLHKSFGAHQISCLRTKDRQHFINYCEEAAFMLKAPEEIN